MSKQTSILLAFCLFLGVTLFAVHGSGQTTPEPRASTNLVDKAECEAQLLRIHAAIQEYRATHQKLPDWLSDLSREKLIPEDILVCPYVNKTYSLVEWRRDLRSDTFRDTKTSYSYEFCAAELLLFGGEKTTWREYKERKLKMMGTSVVPIVRCFAHRPVLNLIFDGSINESGEYWEDKYTNLFAHPEITSDALFAERLRLPNLTMGDFPGRDPELDARYLDLTRFYNARLTDTWLHAPSFVDNLAELPAGVLAVGNVKFDVRGIIQLKGKYLFPPYPDAIRDIPVQQKCHTLHFLHATAADAPNDTKVGHYVLHYDDSSIHKIPLVYGREVSDWWFDPKGPARQVLQVAWQGRSLDSIRGGKGIRLYVSHSRNPKPDILVQSIDFASANSSAAPFLIAVTLE